MAGSHNDINILQRSSVFGRLADGNAPSVSFEVIGHTYTKGYYLADGIYPEWPIFVKTRCNPTEEKYSRFAKKQEAYRKDVEGAFGVLQSRWAIVRHPAKTWSVQQMWEVMIACVIMHNMIVDEKRDDSVYDQVWGFQGELVVANPIPSSFQEFLHTHHEIRDRATHLVLHEDLVNYIWIHAGNNPSPTLETTPFKLI
jgi:hypothetical protein